MPQRAIDAVVIVALLVSGFLYSATGTVRFYREVFARPAVGGSNGAIDENLRLVNLASGQRLREATDQAGWPADADVAVLAPVSTVSDDTLTQLYYSFSYLLYPRRLWLAAWCDGEAAVEECSRRHALSDAAAAVAGHHARRVILIGRSNPFVHASGRRLSNELSLIDLE
jgi:hypothetical protein